MAPQISEEESNYLKVVFVLLRIATPLVRVLFDKEVHPIQLKKELQKARPKLHRLLNQAQMDLLFPTSVVGLGGDKKGCEELETKIFSAYELCFVQDEIKLKNELSEVLDKVIGIVEKVTSNEFQDDVDEFGAFDDHKRLWTLFTDTGMQVLYHFVELRLPPTLDKTYSLRKFLDKHRHIFHQPYCLCFQQVSEDGPPGEAKRENCFPEYFDKINVSVEDCPLNDLIDYLMKAGKCNETEKNWFETIMQIIQAQTSWDDLEKIKYLAEPVRFKNIVQLQINTLKMVVEEFKLLNRKKRKGLTSHKEGGHRKCAKGQDLLNLENDAYMERFEKRTAIIKISKRKLENTDEWDVTISTEEKRAKMRIDGLAEEEEIKVLDNRDLFQCEIGSTSSIKIVNVKKGSIQLYLRAASYAFKSHKSFRSSIRAVIQRVLEVGQVDTSIEGTFSVQVTFDTGETRDRIGVIQQLIYQNIMDEELDRDTDENEDIQIRYRQLEETVHSMREENEDIKTRNKGLVEIINRLQKSEKFHQKKTKELEESVYRLKMATEENKEIRTRNRELEESVNRLKDENEEIQRRDMEQEETVDRLKDNEDLHKNRMGELASKMTRLKVVNEANEELQTKNRELAETVNRLKGENEVFRKNIKEQSVDRFNQLAKITVISLSVMSDYLKLLATVRKYFVLANQGKETELSRFLEKNYGTRGVKKKTGVSFEKMFALDLEDRNKEGSNYTNNCIPVVIDIYSRGFFETTVEDQKDLLDKGTVECLDDKVSEPEWKLDLFREINGYEYEETENSWSFEEEKQNKVLPRKNM